MPTAIVGEKQQRLNKGYSHGDCLRRTARTLLLVLSGGNRNSMIVEAKDVRFFDVAEVDSSGKHAVRIDGLVFHSSLAVERIELRRGGDDIIIEVYLTPAKKGSSGRFVIEVPLDEGVKRILFGPSGVQIWPNLQA